MRRFFDCVGLSVSALFEAVRESMKIGYSKFHRCLKMLDAMRLVDVTHIRRKGGREVVTLRGTMRRWCMRG